MLSLIIEELNKTLGYLWEEDWDYAFHAGKAGGIAAAIGARGLLYESLCDDISDAYERLDLVTIYNEDSDELDPEEFEAAANFTSEREGAYWVIVSNLKELPENDSAYDNVAAARMGWEEYGVALNEALQAKAAGDGLRYALMTGLVSGLMFRDPGPRYPEGSILNAIEEGFEQNDEERLRWARARLAAAHRLSDPTPFMGKDAYDGCMKEKLETMRWVQNFGLLGARSADENVAVPNSMMINHVLREQAQRGEG